MQQCPACRKTIARPAAEGGVLLKGRYLRVTEKGKVVIACQHCGSELERLPVTGRLVLFQERAFAKSSLPQSESPQPAS